MNTQWRTLTILTFTLIMFSSPRSVAGQGVSMANAGNGDQSAVLGKRPVATVDDAAPAVHKRGWRYTIHPSDTLELTFMLTPEFNQTVAVQPDGYITLRDIGDVPAAGKTLPELTESIKEAYGKILHDPVISIDPKDF